MNTETTTKTTGAEKRPAAKPKPTRKKSAAKARKPPAAVTVEQLSQQFLDHLKKLGKSPSTQVSYAGDLMLAIEVLGADTKVSALTTQKIQAFNESGAVKKTAAGKPKARPTILKTRRVLRMALTWASETGKIKEAPLPDRKLETKV